jgi:hypothetical protein
MFRALRSDEIAGLPADVRAYSQRDPPDARYVPGYAPDRPLITNFTFLPRCYPPGMFLVAAPSALLYHYGLVSFSASNRLFLGILAIAWFVSVIAWTASWADARPSWFRQLATAFLAGYMWYWTMEGFYDIVAIACGSVGVELLRRQKPAYASLAWGLAVFIHVRLLALLPIAVIAMIATVRTWNAQTAKQRAALAVGMALTLGALTFAALIQPIVRLHATAQPGLLNVLRFGSSPIYIAIVYAVGLMVLVALLWREGNRQDAAIALFCGLAFGTQRYLTPWYWMLVVPWALGPSVNQAKSTPVGGVARTYLTVAFLFAAIASKW